MATTKKARERKQAPVAEPKFARIVAAFANERDVSYGGKGFGSTALKVNGKIFAMLSSRAQFVVKLPKERVAELVRLGVGELFDPGRSKLMKEWLALESASRQWLTLAREACAHARARNAK